MSSLLLSRFNLALPNVNYSAYVCWDLCIWLILIFLLTSSLRQPGGEFFETTSLKAF